MMIHLSLNKTLFYFECIRIKRTIINIQSNSESMEHIGELGSTMSFLLEESNRTTENIESGLTELDKITAGCRKSELIVIAGERKMGKTALMITLLRNMLYEKRVSLFDNKLSIAYFSVLENKFLVTSYLLSNICNVSIQQLRDGKLMPSQKMDIEHALKKIEGSSLFIDDRSELSVSDIKESLEKLSIEDNARIDAIFIDGLNLMNLDGELCMHTDKALGLTILGLKALAKSYEVPVFVSFQTDQTDTERSETRPCSCDLYKKNNLFDSADMMWFIYRPEYYQITEDLNGNSLIGTAEVIVSKNAGHTGVAKMNFKHDFHRFEDIILPEAEPEPVFGKYD